MASSASIMDFLHCMQRQGVCLHGFELRRDGSVLAEGYFAPFRKGEMHRMYSVSKTMTALAVGILAGEGKLSPADPIVRYFPDKLPADPDPRLMRLTIHDMLRMATCYPKTTYREGVDFCWDESFFTAKATHEPGTMFNYDTSCSQVLAALCQRVSGRKLLPFLEERVFTPIGATDPKIWLEDPSGVPQGGTGLMMSLRDLGKTAQLVADGGRKLIPGDFIARMTSRQIVNEAPSIPAEAAGYGYQTWMIHQGWAMCGMGGQIAVYHPETKLLLCTVADVRLDPLGIQKIYSAFYDVLVARAGEEERPGDASALARMLENLRMTGLPHAGGALNPTRRIYRMEANQQGLAQIALDGTGVTLTWPHGQETFSWVTPGENCSGFWSGTAAPVVTCAGLTQDGALHVRCQLIHHAPCGVEMFLHEKNGTLSVRMRKSSDPMTRLYEGIFFGTLQP